MSIEVLERMKAKIEQTEALVGELRTEIKEAIQSVPQQLELDLRIPAPALRVGVDDGIAWKEVRFGQRLISDEADLDLLIKARVTSWKEHTVHGLEVGDVQTRGVSLARLILERKLGRPIKQGHEVNHGNFHRWDNRRENLTEVTKSENQKDKRPFIQPARQLDLPFAEMAK